MTITTSEVPITVVARVRPFVGCERELDTHPCLHCIPNEARLLIGNDRQFSFDHVLDKRVLQSEVYEKCVASLIDTFFEGYNVTVFAYGHTGSGKTFTMGTGSRSYFDDDECGIIPRAISDIFQRIQSTQGKVASSVKVSFIEVYREEIADLLANDSKNLFIREDEKGETVVVGVSRETVETADETLTLLDAGTAMRHVGATNMNELSSRSHCIFSLYLEQFDLEQDNSKMLTSQFHFVDLAGSERAHRTGNKGERFKESVSINTGLLALGNVISALSSTATTERRHVPYRESKLTRLLKDSLGGNSRTLMITCLSPALSDLDENINSLKYAARAKLIRNKPILNWNVEDSKVDQMASRIQMLEGELSKQNTVLIKGRQNKNIDLVHKLQFEIQRLEEERLKSLQCFNEVSSILQVVSSFAIPNQLKQAIATWRTQWNLLPPEDTLPRPLSAPLYGRSFTKSNLSSRNDYSKTGELEELRREVQEFGEENAALRLELDKSMNKCAELEERLIEKEINRISSSEGKSNESDDVERIRKRLQAKNSLLISQVDEMDSVEHDSNISSEDENEEEVEEEKPEETTSNRKRKPSNIPRPVGMKFTKRIEPSVEEKANELMLQEFVSGRESAALGVKESDRNRKEIVSRMKELEQNIKQKEDLISELSSTEKQAKEALMVYKEKLDAVEKEYTKAKKELDNVKQKLDGNKDDNQKNKLENDYKKKLKILEKKHAAMKQKESAHDGFSSILKNKEKRISDLEASLGRTKNHYNEVERQHKREVEKMAYFENECRRNELRIQELERTTDQQQKLLKRKTEEVAAAQRKLRFSNAGNNGAALDSEVEKKQQWLEGEIEKIVSRQRDMEVFEDELAERDESLKKREQLLQEKKILEIKRSKSNQEISNSIIQLSLQMETIDGQIEKASVNGVDDATAQLITVKEDLTKQKAKLEKTAVTCDGLDAGEQRRLIELDEAVEAVEEALKYKNALISETQPQQDHSYKKVEYLISNMGQLATDEYKHLLSKLFVRIIALRRNFVELERDHMRTASELSQRQRHVHELERTVQVIESRYESMLTGQNSKYEKDTRFFIEQIKSMENELCNVRETSDSERRSLEKELYYYKVQAKTYRHQIKELTSSSESTDERRASRSENVVRLPPVKDSAVVVKQHDVIMTSATSEQKEDMKKLKEVFESKPTKTTKRSKEMSTRKRSDQTNFSDSLEMRK